MEKLGRSRRLYYRDGMMLSGIARKTGFARNAVKRWLKAAEGMEPRYRRRKGQTKITSFAGLLTKALETDAHRPKRDRRSALKLHAELKAAGFPGDYSRVTEFVRCWREGGGEALVKAFVPLKFELGEAFQFDWSEEHLVIGGGWRKIMAAQPAAHLAGSRPGAIRIPCRAQCLAALALSGAVAGAAPHRVRGSEHCRDARARAARPDADGHPL